MINNKGRLNGLKGIIKIRKIESQFLFEPSLYNIQRNDDVKHRGMKFIPKNNFFQYLNIVYETIVPYGSKGVLRHYYYRSYKYIYKI